MGSDKASVRVWDVVSGAERASVRVPTAAVHRLEISATGDRVAVAWMGSEEKPTGGLSVYDAAGKELFAVRELFGPWVSRPALSPDGRVVVWFPLYAIDRDALRSIVSALTAEFPAVYALVLDRYTPDLMLLATQPSVLPQPMMPAIVSSFMQFCSETT